MTNHTLTPDTQTILLLCGSLGKSRTQEQPLTLGEYNQLVQWLQTNNLRPAQLLDTTTLHTVEHEAPLPFVMRLAPLLERGAALALAVEGWTHRGLWVMSRSDHGYPQRLRTRLGRHAPPILYGVGNTQLLENGGVAMVGSRDVGPEGLAFTKTMAATCAKQDLQIVSGGARGVDVEAMLGALEMQGQVVGILSDSLNQMAVARKYREGLREGHLVLISPFDPDAGFHVGNAMSRNKQIYALSDFAVVVSASPEKGGTWHGAIENLNHRWVPLFVYANPLLFGNQQLLVKGGIPIDEQVLHLTTPLKSWFDDQQLPTNATLPFDTPDDPQPPDEQQVCKERVELETENGEQNKALNNNAGETALSELNALSKVDDLFPIVWPYIQRALHTARSDQEVAAMFQIELKQARVWLQRAVELGYAHKQKKPVRYIIAEEQAQPRTDHQQERLL